MTDEEVDSLQDWQSLMDDEPTVSLEPMTDWDIFETFLSR